MKNKSVLIIGAGGHAKVLVDSLRTKNISILGMLDVNPDLIGKEVLGIRVLGSEDNILKNYSPADVDLVNGMGSTGIPDQRKKIFLKFKELGYCFLNITHLTAYVGDDVIFGQGAQLMAGSIIQPGGRMGENVILNTRAAIDHDCYIGDHVHLAPGVICCGGVTIGHETHIGSGAVILQGITIGDNCIIAAGAVVTRNVHAATKVAGVPAKIME